MPDPFRSKEDLPKAKKKKKKKKDKRGQLAICECLRTHKKIFVRHFRLSHGELGRGEGFSKFFF